MFIYLLLGLALLLALAIFDKDGLRWALTNQIRDFETWMLVAIVLLAWPPVLVIILRELVLRRKAVR